MATKTNTYAHSFFVGSFNGKPQPTALDDKIWKKEVLSDKEYRELCSMYYRSHVDAMMEAEHQSRPDFLNQVRHYRHEVDKTVAMILEKETGRQYKFKLNNLHLYFFPLDIVLVGIEIDETGADLNDLTKAHWWLANWKDCYQNFTTDSLKEAVAPLAKFIKKQNIEDLIEEGNNMKVFQVVQTDDERPDDALLYEIANFIPLGSVNGNVYHTPNKDYYEHIIKNNSVAPFQNWKALALVDSFTVLASKTEKEFKDWPYLHCYYPLAFLRCVYEKTYCVSRNIAYRLNRANENLLGEIAGMEKYYSYENISYNFLPTMLYRKIAQGMEIEDDKREVTKQIKERIREKRKQKEEKETRNRSLALAFVSIFAVFSTAWGLFSLVKESKWFDGYLCCIARAFIVIAVLAVVVLLLYIFVFNRNKVKNNDSLK